MSTHLLAIVAAGVRRFLVVLGGLAALTAAGALALTALGGWDANRALSVAFDVVGCSSSSRASSSATAGRSA